MGGRVYIDDGHSHDYQRGEYLYEELAFDGSVLRAAPAPTLPGAVASTGLAKWPKRNLRVERVVLLGLPRQPRSAQLAHEQGGGPDLLQLTSEQVGGGTWRATVKKPT